MTKAFTLIELLVVITIIVVLLALLVPALDKAIYQAQLAVCGANQRATAQGALTYAFSARRQYPFRQGIRDESRVRAMYLIRTIPGFPEGPNNTPPPDQTNDMPVLKSFLAPDQNLHDPLGPGEVSLEGSDLDTFLYSDYDLWFGFGYRGQSKMLKIGDRMGWSYDEDGDGKAERYRFSALVSDMDRIGMGDTTLCSHPDRDGVLAAYSRQDQAGVGIGTIGAVKQTINVWLSNTPRRGLIDMNVAFDDGSVGRYSEVPWDAWTKDGAMKRLPENTSVNDFPTRNHHHLPTQ